jgi:hypothetical protein
MCFAVLLVRMRLCGSGWVAACPPPSLCQLTLDTMPRLSMLAGPLRIDPDLFHVHLCKRLAVVLVLQQRRESRDAAAAESLAGLAVSSPGSGGRTGPATLLKPPQSARHGTVGRLPAATPATARTWGDALTFGSGGTIRVPSGAGDVDVDVDALLLSQGARPVTFDAFRVQLEAISSSRWEGGRKARDCLGPLQANLGSGLYEEGGLLIPCLSPPSALGALCVPLHWLRCAGCGRKRGSGVRRSWGCPKSRWTCWQTR